MEEKILPRPGVGIMLLNEREEVLLGRRSPDPAKSLLHGENTWSLPGGKLRFGEHLEDCASREVLEETGIRTGSLNLISLSEDIVPDAHFVSIGFLCREFEGEPRALEPEEMTEWKWFSLGSLPEPMFPPSMRIIDNYKKKKIR